MMLGFSRGPRKFTGVNRFHTGLSSGRRVIVRCTGRENETAEETLKRRLRESQQVEQRVVELQTHSEFENKSDDALVVLEVSSDVLCETGLEEEVEYHWKNEQKEKQAQLDEVCSQIKHVFQRTARECKDVKFFAIDCDTENGSLLSDELQIDTVPTLQFYRKGQLLWEHKGVLHLERNINEGVLFYANTYAGGADASAHVFQINTIDDFNTFIQEAEDESRILKVVDVSIERAEPCIKIYPAVLALARNLKGYVKFARVLVDDPKTSSLAQELNIIDVPTFLYYKEGKEIIRHASSSRGDLIGDILTVQGMLGLPLPPPPPKSTTQNRRSRKMNVK
eukprot:g6379.t1